MKCLITGGAGFIGSHIAEELIAKNAAKPEEIIIFDNLSVGKQENIPKGCIFIRGDIRNKEEITKAMKDVDIVFHDAAFVSIRASFDKLEEEVTTNCIGTLNVFQAALHNKIKKIIFASSMAIYGEPCYMPVDEKHPLLTISPYGLSKIRGEMYCKVIEESGIKATVLRYFNTYGTRQTPSPYVGVITTFIKQALNNQPLTVFGDGEQTRDFVWVRDIANANVLAAMSDKSGVYNIGSGTETSINEIADKIIEILGSKKLYTEPAKGEITKIRANISKVTNELGYKPQGKVLERIAEIIDYWKRNS